MYHFSPRDYFTLNSGLYKIEEGIVIKQKPLPSGQYSNVSVFSTGDYYNSVRDDFQYIRLFTLQQSTISRVTDVNTDRLLKQYQELEELNSITAYPVQFTRQKIYLFLQWAEKKGIMRLLTQEQVACFCGVERTTVQRHFTEMRKLKLITV